MGRTSYHRPIRKVIMIIHYKYRATPTNKRYAIITSSIVELFIFCKKDIDLGIGEPACAPSLDHPFIVGYRLFGDPTLQIDPATPTGSNPISIKKHHHVLINFDHILIKIFSLFSYKNSHLFDKTHVKYL